MLLAITVIAAYFSVCPKLILASGLRILVIAELLT